MDDKEKLEFEYALHQRNFEIDLFWKRSWFFGALLTVIITGYFLLYDEKNYPVLSDYRVCISFIIIIIVYSQVKIIRGSKYWQERWEYKTINRESKLGIYVTKDKIIKNIHEKYYTDSSIIAKNENFLTMSYRNSVSKYTFLVWDILLIVCILFWINDIVSNYNRSNIFDGELTAKIFTFHFIIFVYVTNFINQDGKSSESFFKGGRSNTKEENELISKSNNKEYLKEISEKYLNGDLEKDNPQ